MIYFDNAATSFQKPASVYRAVTNAMRTCASAGRSGHVPAMNAAEALYRCREEAAALFGMDTPERVTFTHNATQALNMAIKAVEDHNKAHPESPVSRIAEFQCELGLLACVEAQTLTACFELLAEGTLAEGAKLTLACAPLPCTCNQCGHEFSLTQRHFVCPS